MHTYMCVDYCLDELRPLAEDDTLDAVAAQEVGSGEVEARPQVHDVRHHLRQPALLRLIEHVLVHLHKAVQQLGDKRKQTMCVVCVEPGGISSIFGP